MGYMGFKKVEAAAAKGGARDPGAVAYMAGKKKYGAKAMHKAASSGRSLRGHRTLRGR